MIQCMNLVCRWGCPLLLFWLSACAVGGETFARAANVTIRYGENGVPNFFKGENLSAPLEKDPAFRAMQAEKRYADIAFYFLDSQRERFHLTSAREEFTLRSIDVDASGQKHIRLDQVYKTLAVWGKDLGVHLNRNNQVYYVHGTYQPVRADLPTTADLSRQSAERIALAAGDDGKHWRVLDTELVVWAPDNDVQRLAFKVTRQGEDLVREACFVDAKDGTLLHVLSITPTNGFNINVNNINED